MKTRYLAMMGVCAVALVAAVAGRWLGSCEDRLREAEASAADASRVVSEVLQLRGQRERASLRAQQKQDVLARILDTVAACGIEKGVQWEVAPGSGGRSASGGDVGGSGGSGGSGGRYAQQTMRLSVRNVRLQDLGRFVERWRVAQPLWTISGFDLVRVVPTVSASSKAPQGERFDAGITITAPYIAPSRREASIP